MINVQGLRRNVKNVVRNYTDAQVKVREATSNDPWGPSSTLMSEIADLTYNVVAFVEIMQIVWKRLNDHGKNWRHVYKALVLLEYLIKTGSEKVAQQCRENIFVIQTLKDFQYMEDNKDHGLNVREKAKQLVTLLTDEERLKNERARALKTRERFAQALSHARGPDSAEPTMYHSSSDSSFTGAVSQKQNELEHARPQTAGEEELQLQLALAMSKEEAEKEDRLRKNDDLRLQMALTESQEDFKRQRVGEDSTSLDDLMGLSFSNNNNRQPLLDPWGMPISPPAQQLDPWNSPVSAQTSPGDPWQPASGEPAPPPPPQRGVSSTNGAWPAADPWVPQPLADEFDTLMSRKTSGSASPDLADVGADLLDMGDLQQSLPQASKTPESFLGKNSNLVNLDALVSSHPRTGQPEQTNPFALTMPAAPPPNNPFQAGKAAPPTINQLRANNQFGGSNPFM